jgi:uncharacterized cupin superfamily protein
MVPEAPLEPSGKGLSPTGEGWFVLNAKDARWLDGAFGAFTQFQGDAHFPEFGFNIGVIHPGQPASMYHAEENQEDFLVVQGECLLLVEGQERLLRQWDMVHCPPWTEHVFVGAGDGPCAVIAVGGRTHRGLVYPVSELALKHGAGVEAEVRTGKEAYAGFEPDVETTCQEGWLPG